MAHLGTATDASDLGEVLQRDLHRQLTKLATHLGEAVEGQAAIYLDTRYWILLRDAQGGGDPRARELLSLLRCVVHSGRAFCPVSDAIIFEIWKQTDLKSRRQTALLVEELSRGVAILCNEQLIATELAHFIHNTARPLTGEELFPLRRLIWTRGCGAIGISAPYTSAFRAADAISIQRRVVEHLWHKVSVVDILMRGSRTGAIHKGVADLARRLAGEIALHKESLSSFDQALEDEIVGAADTCSGVALEICAQLSAEHGVPGPEQGSAEWEVQRRSWRTIVAAAVRMTPSREQLRSLRVLATLHAALRWNKGQRLVANDLFDFEHARAAIAHCDAFFTDGPFCHMVTARHVALDRLFGCRVVGRLEDAIEYVAALATSPRADEPARTGA